MLSSLLNLLATGETIRIVYYIELPLNEQDVLHDEIARHLVHLWKHEDDIQVELTLLLSNAPDKRQL